MAKSKKESFAETLKGKTKVAKKKVIDIDEAEAITKKVYKEPKEKEEKEEVQKTTIDLPKKIHFLAKMMAMKKGKKLKYYILDLITDDLKKEGEL